MRVPLCSNTNCTDAAVTLEPRHLCRTCSKDPALDGPAIADTTTRTKKKGKKTTHGNPEAP